MILVGKASFLSFTKKLQEDKSIKLKKIPLNLINTTIYKDKPFFNAVYQENILQQLVFFSNHSSRFLYGGFPKEAIYSDIIWNAAATLAHVKVLSADLFSRLAITTRIRTTGWNRLTLQQKKTKIQEAQVNPTVEAQRKTGFKNLEGRRGRPSPHLKAIHQARRNREPEVIAA